ncbi:hypothetical protein BC939DRAFT_19936 [Gamsiella multidivaricata]|uniref:uncharacterized protein n=1 Tax=Gamsiella multidivaricata TaxID=101098 RepID=UPI0022205918|nr:uncharacterized protein BC939DRAFT_19936 [Gamsiella multidivaricata]KAI7817034.1 hypothetical protein BC939DRAFT_19936 [Gamsiella multidivaricata]
MPDSTPPTEILSHQRSSFTITNREEQQSLSHSQHSHPLNSSSHQQQQQQLTSPSRTPSPAPVHSPILSPSHSPSPSTTYQQQPSHQYQHQHQYNHPPTRSNSQSAPSQEHLQRALHQQQQHQQQLIDLISDSDYDSDTTMAMITTALLESQHSIHPPLLQPQQSFLRQHTFDMARFLDFTVEASVLLETLHQNGLIHGQLSPTSFRWEESSSLKAFNSSNTSGTSNTSNSNGNGVSSPPLSSSTFTTPPSAIRANSDQSLSAFPPSPSPRHSFQGHPSRKENHTSPSQLTLDRAGSIAKTSATISNSSSSTGTGTSTGNSNSSSCNNNTKPAHRSRRYSLVLDCTHLGLGEKSTEPVDSPAKKGLRDHAAAANVANGHGHGSPSTTLGITLSSTVPIALDADGSGSNTSGSIGSLLDPALFSPHDLNLQPYSSGSNGVLHDTISSRMARIKRSLLSSSASSPAISQSASSASPASSSATSAGSTASGVSGSSQPLVIKQHFLLHVPQELHSPPGCVLPVQIDIYSLGVMFYYLWASYSAFQPEVLTQGAIAEGLNSFASGNGSAAVGRIACHAATPARLANVIHRMVAKA